MVRRIDKALAKFSKKERWWIEKSIEKLLSGKTQNLNIKKLKGHPDIFRIRKGTIRVMYRLGEGNAIFILAIERRKEDTYKNY